MKINDTGFEDLWLIEPNMMSDDRGAFGRIYCEQEFKERGLKTHFPQWSTSFNKISGTVRGMHFQKIPKPEVKIVRCTRGKIFDVAVDLRKNSKTFLKWFGIELSHLNRLSLYIPVGFAHGFQTLEDETEVFYAISENFDPNLASGVRWNDPKIGVVWPQPISTINSRDSSWPNL